jgi:protein-S-isoprenylcysteine O-methyltransferase Ste14
MERTSLFFLLILAPALAICLALLGLETLRDNLLGWILFCLGVACTGGIVIDYHQRRGTYRSLAAGGGRSEERGNVSFWLILPGFLAAFFASPLEWLYLEPTLPRTMALQVVGGFVFFAGLVLLIGARLVLRGSYTAHLAGQVGQRLVERGPYRFVRHPAYLGQLLMALGVAIGYSSAIGLGAIPILLIPGLAYRIRVEERLLTARLGETYAAYVRRTRRLIPGVW